MSKKTIVSAFAAAAALTCAAEFGIDNVEVYQGPESRQVRISYDLKDVPAIITIDVKTNGATIGAANITHLSGDVNKIVTKTGERCTAYWQADKSWPDHLITDGSVTIDVVAWATNRPPDYCVVNLKNGDVRYYTAADQLPGGGLTNAIYKSDYLVMRYIAAAGVPWYMGSTNEKGRQADRETYQQITLTNNYYIGVYEFTQAQWKKFFALPSSDTSKYDIGDDRPMAYFNFGYLRESSDGTVNASYDWPSAPASASLFGQLRSLTGQQLAFDLPSEAQWEYACRSGTTEGHWNDGSDILVSTGTDANLNNLARYTPTYNVGEYADKFDGAATTAGVGTFRPNLWGLYDMHGNVREMCLDWYKAAYRYPDEHAYPCTDKTNNAHSLRGGQAQTGNANHLRSAARSYTDNTANRQNGFRVAVVLP